MEGELSLVWIQEIATLEYSGFLRIDDLENASVVASDEAKFQIESEHSLG